MLDVDDYLTLAEAAARLPRGRTGRPVATATIARWITAGVKATGGRRIFLRGVRLPGGWRTRGAWVEEFLAALTEAALAEARRPPIAPEEAAVRRFEVEQAKQKLAAMGLL